VLLNEALRTPEVRVFHLAWFLGNGFGIQPWNTTRGVWNGKNAYEWMKPELYVDMTSSLERAGFDYLLIEDTTSIDDTYGGSMDTTLRRGFMAPKNDPLPLVPLLTQTTKHIGIVPTISTSFYHPYTAARLMTTLDHLTCGRVGINVVTSVNHRAAQNFGYDRHHEHDLRYEMAHEWLDVASHLWESWDEDAIQIDEIGNRYADHTKVHPIDFEGRFFKSRGPLNTIPGPQRRPVVAQAGSSSQGRALAAEHADTILALVSSVEDMKAYRKDVRDRMEDCGRKPDDCKILFLVTPLISETDEMAREEQERRRVAAWEPEQLEQALWYMSYQSGGEVDFSKYDLDEPMPQVVGNGEQSVIAAYTKGSQEKTLREIAATRQLGNVADLVGSPDTVAAKMGEVMEEVGGDGFIFYSDVTRRSFSEVADGLAPALRRRGLIRSGYDQENFRENLLEF
jgi:FMN-dependent oxidoreductase (nitrilotriacetate monooxygenase family)